MGIALSEVYSALEQVLGADLSGVPVYKTVADDQEPPFVRWGMLESTDARTKTHAGSRVIITVDAWTKKQGFRELYTTLENAASKLTGTLSINGHTTRLRQLGSIRAIEEEAGQDATQIYQHGTLEYVLELKEN